jgi:ABC-type bacteriocin/lantibiotic exporter with double-glycine peptidase domain
MDWKYSLARGCTALIIAHRLLGLRACHRILTIEKGRLVEFVLSPLMRMGDEAGRVR